MVATRDVNPREELRAAEFAAACEWLCENGGDEAAALAKQAKEHASSVGSKEKTLMLADALGAALRTIQIETAADAGEAGAAQKDATATVAANAAAVLLGNSVAKQRKTSLEGVAQVAMSALNTYAQMDQEAVRKLSANVSARKEDGAIRLRINSLLYNAVSDETPEGAAVRYEILMNMVRSAKDCGRVPIMRPVFLKVDGFMQKWNLDLAKRKALFEEIADALRSHAANARKPVKDEYQELALEFSTKALVAFDAEKASDTDQQTEQEKAASAVLGAIMLESRFRFDEWLEIEAVRKLESSHPHLWELLNIFVCKIIDDYIKFAEEHGDYLQNTLHLDHEYCLTKMRLLTFTSLGIQCQELSYGDVAKALRVEAAEVEDWIIQAISCGLVDAKLDQIQEKVIVNRATHRVFSKEQWQPLSARINAWKVNLDDLLDVLHRRSQMS
ncbi:Eukaryotic translation initiation factor 3 subunit M [Porphyridium purpureum]|uniref:Eukaryotic translation initiation factor 3 subunit M n=1 Tax=Porphyridium purpureum TaxID=35688 RepID=A0A5J4Z885_PORPP|nr:Eukaryotic translation initiation factor 3 subunit M [Porphyridium purpureum]|eukprot:POR4896..scf295_1